MDTTTLESLNKSGIKLATITALNHVPSDDEETGADDKDRGNISKRILSIPTLDNSVALVRTFYYLSIILLLSSVPQDLVPGPLIDPRLSRPDYFEKVCRGLVRYTARALRPKE